VITAMKPMPQALALVFYFFESGYQHDPFVEKKRKKKP